MCFTSCLKHKHSFEPCLKILDFYDILHFTFCKNKCFKDKEKWTSKKLGCTNAMELVEPYSVGDLVVVVDNCELINPVEVVERYST